jgi:WD40 repeat protein
VYSGRWDLASGSYQPSAASFPPDTVTWFASPLLAPPSLAYQWESSGKLASQATLPVATTPAIGAIGNPMDGPVFSIWQPGTVELRTTGISQAVHRPGIFIFSTDFVVLSPDGRYLLADASALAWRLAVPGQSEPDGGTLADLGLSQSPVLPVRDTALAQIMSHWKTDSAGQLVEANVPVNWSPDGLLLATPTGQKAVTIYDCATGQQLNVVQDQSTGPSVVSQISGVSWSPDSKRLFYWDETSGALRIADVGKANAR